MIKKRKVKKTIGKTISTDDELSNYNEQEVKKYASNIRKSTKMQQCIIRIFLPIKVCIKVSAI